MIAGAFLFLLLFVLLFYVLAHGEEA